MDLMLVVRSLSGKTLARAAASKAKGVMRKSFAVVTGYSLQGALHACAS